MHATMGCYFCQVDVRPGARVCAACGAGIQYGPKVSDVLFYGVLFAALAAIADEAVLNGGLPVAMVASTPAGIGVAVAVMWYRGKVCFRRHVP
jgi:hypothetical protein